MCGGWDGELALWFMVSNSSERQSPATDRNKENTDLPGFISEGLQRKIRRTNKYIYDPRHTRVSFTLTF